MKTNIQTTNNLTMISQMSKDSKFQVLEYEKLDGGNNISQIKSARELNRNNIKLRQLRIILENSMLFLQTDKLGYFVGDITVKNEIEKEPMSLGKRILSGKLLEEEPEKTVRPIYEGSGEIFLKPKFKNYVLLELQDEEIIVPNELFVVAEATLEIEEQVENNIKLIKLFGNGIVVLETMVPEDEIFRCNLNGNTIKINGNMVILRKGDISYSTETNVDDINLENPKQLEVYSGMGEIWLVPTNDVYNNLGSDFN